MCATYFIDNKEVSSVGQLRKHIDPTECYSEVYLLRYPDKDHSLIDEECLCAIDPLIVAMRLDKLVLCDPAQAFYTFKDRKDG